MRALSLAVCSDELTKANAKVATKDAEAEEKNMTIVQVWMFRLVLLYCWLGNTKGA